MRRQKRGIAGIQIADVMNVPICKLTDFQLTHLKYDSIASDRVGLVKSLVSEIIRRRNEDTCTNPPRVAEFCLLLIPLRQREHILGDLEEEFNTQVVPEYGIFWAHLYYYWQVLMELVTAIVNGVKGIVR